MHLNFFFRYKLSAILVVIACMAALCYVFIPIDYKYSQCKECTKRFQGGVRYFHGIEYYLEVCNVGSFENANFMILKVFDAERKLLARKAFTDDSHIPFPMEFEFSDNGFTYFTSKNLRTYDFDELFVSFPPTQWDKFKANYTNLD